MLEEGAKGPPQSMRKCKTTCVRTAASVHLHPVRLFSPVSSNWLNRGVLSRTSKTTGLKITSKRRAGGLPPLQQLLRYNSVLPRPCWTDELLAKKEKHKQTPKEMFLWCHFFSQRRHVCSAGSALTLEAKHKHLADVSLQLLSRSLARALK